MDMKNQIPFEVGQMVESKSFMKGFRSAWFRCKIKKIRKRRGFLECILDYCDYPGEKIKWTNIYEAPPKDISASSDLKQRKKELMLRPSFPPVHKESELLLQHFPAEISAVLIDTWRVGDLVDLWCDGCFWSGKIIKLHSVDTVEVELTGKPVGEGGVYKGEIKDLRPSLDWSPEKGWSVPISQANGKSWFTARLVGQPLGRSLNESDQIRGAEGEATDAAGKTLDTAGKVSDAAGKTLDTAGKVSDAAGKESDPSCSLPEIKEEASDTSKNGSENSGGEQNLKAEPDIIGESIMELEEVANKVRWLKGLLKFGFTWSNNRPSWKFVPNPNS